jgi:hypothetical protein
MPSHNFINVSRSAAHSERCISATDQMRPLMFFVPYAALFIAFLQGGQLSDIPVLHIQY